MNDTWGSLQMIVEKAKVYRRFVKNGWKTDDYQSPRDITKLQNRYYLRYYLRGLEIS